MTPSIIDLRTRRAEDHLRRFPHARPSTLAALIARAIMAERLRKEIAAERKRSLLRRIWPSWAWRW